MEIGVLKEIKTKEYRVGLVPSAVQELVQRGHHVWVETNAGMGIGYSDDLYRQAGAKISPAAAQIFEMAELIVKVKEPQPQECQALKPHQTLFTFLHLAADREQARLLQDSGATCIAYETVVDRQGRLPLLAPMSEVAGRISVQLGAQCLEKNHGGKGILLGGVPGVQPAKVVIIGGGVVGTHALKMAMGMGARVTVLDRSLDRLRALEDLFGPRLNTQFATQIAIASAVSKADLIIGAVLIPGGAAPKLVTRDMLKACEPGTVLIDVAIDQGGCFETSRPTTYDNPTYIECGVTHYCVTNLPGGVPRTSTHALNHATLPYITQLADQGPKAALQADAGFLAGLNVCKGHLTHEAVAEALNQDFRPASESIKSL